MEKSIRIFGYEDYELFNDGKVFSHKTNIFLKPCLRNKYLSVRLYKGSRESFYLENLHRLVAIHFVDGRTDEKKYVNHKDGNKLNNNDWNLEWTTEIENINHALDMGLYNFVSQNPLYIYDNIENQLYYFNFQADVERFFEDVNGRGLRKAFANNGKSINIIQYQEL